MIVNPLSPFLLLVVLVLCLSPLQRDSAFLYRVVGVMLLDLVFKSGHGVIGPFELDSEGIGTRLRSGLPLMIEDGRGS